MECAITVWEDRLADFKRTLGRVHIEHDAKYVQAEAFQQDFLAQTCASGSWSKHLIDLNWTLEERQILLSLQDTDIEV
jgi:hypothetical protein